MVTPVFIAGVGMTPFGRHLDRSVRQLASVAIDEALDDAGCTPGQVGEIYFGNTVQGATDGQHMVRGQVALLPLGFQGTVSVASTGLDRVMV